MALPGSLSCTPKPSLASIRNSSSFLCSFFHFSKEIKVNINLQFPLPCSIHPMLSYRRKVLAGPWLVLRCRERPKHFFWDLIALSSSGAWLLVTVTLLSKPLFLWLGEAICIFLFSSPRVLSAVLFLILASEQLCSEHLSEMQIRARHFL